MHLFSFIITSLWICKTTINTALLWVKGQFASCWYENFCPTRAPHLPIFKTRFLHDPSVSGLHGKWTQCSGPNASSLTKRLHFTSIHNQTLLSPVVKPCCHKNAAFPLGTSKKVDRQWSGRRVTLTDNTRC